MPQNEELSRAIQDMKRELLAAIAAVDGRVGRIEANVQLLCDAVFAPGELSTLKKAASGR